MDDESVARGKNIPEKQDLLRRKRLSSKVIAILATDPDPKIRRGVPFHPSAPTRILDAMLLDENALVRQTTALVAKLSESAFDKAIRTQTSMIRSLIARNPQLPRKFLPVIAGDANSEVADDAVAILKTLSGHELIGAIAEAPFNDGKRRARALERLARKAT